MKKTIHIILLLFAVSTSALAQSWIDVTEAYITNPNYDNNSNAGWIINASAGSTACDQGAQEFWNGTWDIHQSVASITNGHYRLSLSGFHRPGDFSNNNAQNWETVAITSMIYANETSQPLKSVYSEYIDENYYGSCWGYTVSGRTQWYPNTMTSAAHCFQLGMYENEMEFDVTDGSLTFGIKNEVSVQSNWSIFDNWKLEYYGTVTSVAGITLSETQKELAVGEKFQLTATVTPADATIQALSWTSSNEGVATVDASGMVTATSEGAAVITATATDGSRVQATCSVTVSRNSAALSSLIITEIQSANIDQFVDPSWNYGGWVELYNPTNTGVTITGCWVSDDASDLKKVHITEPMAVPAEGYLNLWFEHHDKYCPSQLDMKLDVEGGTIYLSDSNGTLIASQAYPEAVSRCSYARKSLTSDDWAWTSTPTPEASNDGSTYCETRLEAPYVDKDSQIFSTTLTVCVNIPEGATLRYTTDGSAPTATHGETSLTGLFYPSSATATYRFCLVQDGYLPSPVVTRTYIYKDKEFALPVFSVVTADENLYSAELGIFVQGVNGRAGNGQSSACNWNMDWDRPANFEFINTEGEMLVNQEVAIERAGGWSRAWTPYSFKVKANKLYELQNYLPYDFFEEKPYLRHRTLQMRNGGNDNTCRIKDPALQEMVLRSGIDVNCQAYEPVMHYINGRYAGTINMREPNNKHYVYANYGLDDDEIDQFEMSPDSGYVQKCGTYESMQRWYDLAQQCSDALVYEQIKEMVDIDEYCNYMAVEFYLGSYDWPQNNLKGWKPIMDGGRFRFVLYDLDGAFSTTNSFSSFAGKQTYTFDYLYGEPVTYITKEIEMVTIFLNMLKNDDFRRQFIDSYCLVVGSVFSPSRCEDIIDELASRVESSQGIYNEVYNTSSSPWGTANDLKNSITSSRQNTMINVIKNYSPMGLGSTTAQSVTLSANISEARLFVNDLPVPTNAFDGKLFAPVTFRAQAPAGYRFEGWLDVSSSDYVCYDEEYDMPTTTGSMVLQACYSEMTDEEKEEAGITVTPVVINEVSAGNSINVNEYFKKDDWVELYNTTSEEIDLEGMYMTDNSQKPQKYQITAAGTKASTLIPAHGYKVIWCSERETDTELHANFKLSNKDGEMVRIAATDGSWADSLVYCAHNGDQSVGRYPDAGSNVYLMTVPTIKASNTLSTYASLWEHADTTTTDTRVQPTTSRSAGMSIACVGDYLSIKSEDSPHVTLGVYTASGMTLMYRKLHIEDGHERVSIAALPRGVYIARARDDEGNECATKFVKH